jgi:hypothetical protein
VQGSFHRRSEKSGQKGAKNVLFSGLNGILLRLRIKPIPFCFLPELDEKILLQYPTELNADLT